MKFAAATPKYVQVILPILIVFEFVIELVNHNYSLIVFRSLPYVLLIYWYLQNFKCSLKFSSFFILGHYSLAILFPILIQITQQKPSTNIEISVNLVGNICLLTVFLDNIFRKKYNQEKKVFGRILIPYILTPICFILIALLPYFNQFYLIFSIIYTIILLSMAIASAYYSNYEIVKLNIALGIGLVFLAHLLNAVRLFMDEFTNSIAFVFLVSVVAKFFMMYGFIKERELNE